MQQLSVLKVGAKRVRQCVVLNSPEGATGHPFDDERAQVNQISQRLCTSRATRPFPSTINMNDLYAFNGRQKYTHFRILVIGQDHIFEASLQYN